MQSQHFTTPTLILYASQTGNCEQISEDLFQNMKALKKYKDLKRRELNSYGLLADKNSIKVVIFICSSTGNGDMPENGEKFFRFLRKETNKLHEDQKSNLLGHVFYTMLGLGSSDYSKFQGVPRFIAQKMKQLGAHEFYYRGEADDATSLELVVEPWLEGLQPEVEKVHMKICGLGENEKHELLQKEEQNEAPVEIKEKQEKSTITSYLTLQKITEFGSNRYGDGKKYYEIEMEFDSADANIANYLHPGQSVAIFPENTDENVDFCLSAFGWKKDELLGNDTVGDLLKKSVDMKSLKVNIDKLLDDTEKISKIKNTY